MELLTGTSEDKVNNDGTSHVADETSALMYGFWCRHLDAQSPILILCLDLKKFIDRQKIDAQGANY